MTDYTLTVNDIVCNGFETPQPTFRTGAIASITVVLWQDGGITDPVSTRYGELLDYLETVRDSTVRTWDESLTPQYRERIPENAPGDSFLLEIEPGSDMIQFEGMWGVLVGGTDESIVSDDTDGFRQLTLDVFKLADLTEHADRETAEAAHSSEVTG